MRSAVQTEQRIFHAGKVTRPDAGGSLWAPVDQHGRELGITPSFDSAAVRRFCDQLNARKLGLKVPEAK